MTPTAADPSPPPAPDPLEAAGEPSTTLPPSAQRPTGARAAWLVGSGIFLSRVSGVVRESVLAYFLGTSAVADVWRVASRTPNVIRNLLGEGTLSASMIPVYAGMLEEGREEDGGRFVGAVLGLLSVVAFGVALVGILLAPVFIPLFFPLLAPHLQDLAVHLVRIMFLMTAVFAVSAWALGVLNSHGKYFVSYLAPVAWNGALVVVLAVFGGVYHWELDRLVVALAWGGVVGAVLQVAVQIPVLLPVLKGFRLSLSRAVPGVSTAVRNFWPVVLARGAVNLSGWADVILAALLAEGAVASLGYAQTVYLLPISVFGMSIAASELPELSREGVRDEGAAELLATRVKTSLERLAFLMVPSMVAIFVLGDVFVGALYQRGLFQWESTALVYLILAAYTLGLMASASSRVLSSAYYALKDTRTPARVAYMRVSLSFVVGLGLMFPLDRLGLAGVRFGAVGLALGASLGAWMEYAWLRRRLTAVTGPHGPDGRRVGRMWMAGLVAGCVGLACEYGIGALAERVPGLPGWAVLPGMALGTALAFGVAYLAVAGLLGVGMPVRRLLRRG